ncbi:MAG: lysine--tRNA ligase, partial [Burkholderiales bacterium]|nr:lysine--tRNA ligase [Burkholderiales bacterium]
MTDPQPAPATTTAAADTHSIVEERRAKLAALRAQGIAFPNDFRRTHLAGDLHAVHGETSGDALDATPVAVAVAGRMMLKRVMGKAA